MAVVYSRSEQCLDGWTGRGQRESVLQLIRNSEVAPHTVRWQSVPYGPGAVPRALQLFRRSPVGHTLVVNIVFWLSLIVM